MPKFEELGEYTHDDVDAALQRDQPEELQRVVIAVALEDGDLQYAEALCLRLARHRNPTVRGNSLLGLGHLARRFGEVCGEGRRLVDEGLQDGDPHVRSQAESAADDIETFVAT